MHQENNKNGIDLSKSLKESAVKSQDGRQSSEPYVSPGAPKIIRLVIKYSGGLIKNERQAAYLLLALVIFAVIISFYFMFGKGGTLKSVKGTEYSPYEGYGGQELPDEYR